MGVCSARYQETSLAVPGLAQVATSLSRRRSTWGSQHTSILLMEPLCDDYGLNFGEELT